MDLGQLIAGDLLRSGVGDGDKGRVEPPLAGGETLAEAIRRAAELEQVAAMGESVEERRGQPLVAGLPITVLTVTDEGYPYAAALAPMLYTEAAAFAGLKAELARAARDESEAAAGRLPTIGLEAISLVREGDPGHGIVALAREREAGLIVVGTRGQTGLRRLVLGSVARNVLLHAPCSVLVVRESAAPAVAGDVAEHDRAIVGARD